MKKGFLSLIAGLQMLSTYAGFLPNTNFKAEKNGLPDKWRLQYNDAAEFKIIDDVKFKEGFRVLEMKNQVEKPVSIRTENFKLPEAGKLKASAWASGGGSVKIYLIPANWKGGSARKQFAICPAWREYEFSFDVPEHKPDKKYFFRIDWFGKGKAKIAAPSLLLVARKSKLTVAEQRWTGTACDNMLVNPDFELGWTGWHPRYFTPRDIPVTLKQLVRPLPYFKKYGDAETALFMPAGNIIESLPVPVAPGKEYTVMLSMKTEKESAVRVFLLDYKWNGYNRKFKTDNSLKPYSFTFKWDKKCVYGEAYFRIDAPRDSGLYVDKVSVVEGKNTKYTRNPVMLGFMSETNFYNRGEKASVTLKSVSSGSLKAYKVNFTALDCDDNKIMDKTFNRDGAGIAEEKIELPSDTYGTFRLKAEAFDTDGRFLGRALGRYAVAMKLPDDFQKHTSMGVNCYPCKYPISYYSQCLPFWKKTGVGIASAGYTHEITGTLENSTYVSLVKKGMEYFRRMGFDLSMRVCMTRKIYGMVCFGDFEKGRAEWKRYITEMVKTYGDVISVFAFMGEVNIIAVRKKQLELAKTLYKGYKVPPLGTKLMSPDKTFKMYKTAYEAAKAVNPEIRVAGPSINGEDFPYVKSFMSLGAGKYMDIFGMDAYRTSPDIPEAYHDYIKLREILKENGFTGPVINLEQYLGICVKGYAGDSEAERRYYTQWNKEKLYAGIIARNYIQHSAAGVSWINFAPHKSLYDPFYLDGGFPSMAGAASAAATFFINKAGRAVKITDANNVKVFVFPDTDDGYPLAVIYSPVEDANASIKMKGIAKAYDFNGNEFDKKQIEAGIPVSTVPVYLKMEKGTTLATMKEYYGKAEILGLSDPFKLNLSLAGKGVLNVEVLNNTNTELDGKLSLVKYPENWKTILKSMEFEGLKSGKTAKFFFSFEKMDVRNLGTYPVELKVQSGDKFSGIQAVLSPMFAQYLPEIKPDGNFSEWEKIEWVNLDTSEDNLVYNKSEKTDGNFKVKFACAWNEEGFALAVEKEDKDFLPPDKTEYNMWMNDSIQVYFDQRKDAEPGLATYGDDDSVYQIGLLRGTPVAYLEQGPEGRYLGPANTVKGVDKDVKVNIRRHDGKTLYEIFFLWKTLKSVKPSTGVTFGFSLFVHDLDPGEDNKRGVSLDKTTPFRHPYVWKDLTLTR